MFKAILSVWASISCNVFEILLFLDKKSLFSLLNIYIIYILTFFFVLLDVNFILVLQINYDSTNYWIYLFTENSLVFPAERRAI